MITYIGLMNLTDKGAQGIKDTTKRAAAAKEAAKKLGVNLREMYWTPGGQYDLVAVIEAEDEQSVTAFGLATGMQGNIRGQTARAYSAGDMEKILSKLG